MLRGSLHILYLDPKVTRPLASTERDLGAKKIATVQCISRKHVVIFMSQSVNWTGSSSWHPLIWIFFSGPLRRDWQTEGVTERIVMRV